MTCAICQFYDICVFDKDFDRCYLNPVRQEDQTRSA